MQIASEGGRHVDTMQHYDVTNMITKQAHILFILSL